jgi:hypothetical protein
VRAYFADGEEAGIAKLPKQKAGAAAIEILPDRQIIVEASTSFERGAQLLLKLNTGALSTVE